MLKKRNDKWENVPLKDRPRKVLSDEEFESLSPDEQFHITEMEQYNKPLKKIKRGISKTWNYIFIIITVLILLTVGISLILGSPDEDEITTDNSFKDNGDVTADFYKLLSEAGIEYDDTNTSKDYLYGLEAEYEAVTLNEIHYNYDICTISTDKLLAYMKDSNFAKAQDYLEESGTGCNIVEDQELLIRTYNEMGTVLYIEEEAKKDDWDAVIDEINKITSPYLKVIMTLFTPSYVQRDLWGTDVITFSDIDDIDVHFSSMNIDRDSKLPYIYYFEIKDKTDTWKIEVHTDGYTSEMISDRL